MADSATWAMCGVTALMGGASCVAWLRNRGRDEASYVTHSHLDRALEKFATNERVSSIDREIQEVKRDIRDLRTENNTGFKDVLAAIKRNGGSH